MLYLLPTPKKAEEKEGCFLFSYETWIDVEPGCSGQVTRQARLFCESVKKILGYAGILRRGTGHKGDIVFRQNDEMEKQSYILDINEDGILLQGEQSGLWFGMQTLLQVLGCSGAVLPCLHIEDAPEIPNRGFYFDCSRGRIPKLEWLKKLADQMSYYKLNQLQLYVEHTYLFRGMTELWRDDTPLTAQEIMEFDYYCMEPGIELIPSLSSFGHLYKLLSSKKYSHLCELDGYGQKPFSVRRRMQHHTIDTTNPESIELVKGMIYEYMQLFSSKQFNFCADETFDLGMGRSKEEAERLGKDRVYIDFVKKLAQFVIDNGRRPMFWGDIIVGFPEMIKELPEGIICLNWGYDPDQSEEPARKIYEAGAIQYCCPGCQGWNQFVTPNRNSYANISRQCEFAKKYGAIGVLNTDWGDYLHLCHPDFSLAGMIYGAAFSWNSKRMDYEEINRQISRMEYGDPTESFLGIVEEIQENNAFEWMTICQYREWQLGIIFPDMGPEQMKEHLRHRLADVDSKNERLMLVKEKLYRLIACMDTAKRELVYPYIVALEGSRLFNEVGKVVAARQFGLAFPTMPDCWELAQKLEEWLYFYKELYRGVSKEGELWRTQELVCWYGDYLRS